MTFYAIELDTCPDYGWQAGPSIDISIATLRNKAELRTWEDGLVLHQFTLGFTNKTDVVYRSKIKAAFLAMGGRLHSFLAKDWGDYTHALADETTPMTFGEGDGSSVQFQLTKTYPFEDSGATYVRPIFKPIVEGDGEDIPDLVIYVDGIAEPDVGVDPLTGIVEFDVAPADGAVLSWTGEFRVCVRFNDFFLPSTVASRFADGKAAVSGGCSLIEVPGE